MNQCESANKGQLAILYVGLYLVAIGTSGVKAAAPPLGADQYDEKDPKEAAKLSSYFNWLMFFLTTGALFGVTFVVWISENQGWDWSFAVCSIVVGFAILFLTLGKSLYRNNVTKGSPLTRIMQVFVVALRNRNLRLPENEHELHEIQDKEARYHTEILQKTEQFKYVNTFYSFSSYIYIAYMIESPKYFQVFGSGSDKQD